jgi:cobalt/nickel transport system permease protein
MHMSDALISPGVGVAGWVIATGFMGMAVRRLRDVQSSSRPALMGVLGAFVFAAQMINFAVPLTGSSGHLSGGLLLSVLLGPHAAFLVMTSVLMVQALLFADGGLLALGCNIVNIGLITCYVVYPLLFRPLAGHDGARRRMMVATLVAATFGLLLGALAVVCETTISGIAQLPFGTFVLFMIPIHFGIGLVEGGVTASVLLYVWRVRPELVPVARVATAQSGNARKLLVSLVITAGLMGATFSWFASTRPDGLEWSVGKTAHVEALEVPTVGLHLLLERIQKKTALLPGYEYITTMSETKGALGWPRPNPGTSLSGVLGAGLTLLLAFGTGFILRRLRSRRKQRAI